MANDGGGLLFDSSESSRAVNDYGADICYFRKAWGAKEFISGTPRACLWLNKDSAKKAILNSWISDRIEITRKARANSPRAATKN